MATDPAEIEKAIDAADAMALLKSASAEELERLKAIEQILQLARERRRHTLSWTLVSSTLVGVVAVVGMLVNAFQSYVNRQQQQLQSKADQERWTKEFTRAQRSDKYRAFFETSVLATDPAKLVPRVRQPILVVQGELDAQIAPSNADRLAALALARKPPLAADVVKVPGVNHLLALAVTGEVDEYDKLPLKQMSPTVSMAVVDWLKKTLK